MDDEALYRSASTGDEPALGDLLTSYLPRLRAFVRVNMNADWRRRESCDDVVQSVCRELVQNESALSFPDETRFRGWLFTAALNKIRHKGRFHGAQRRDVAREVGAATRDDALLEKTYASVHSPSQRAMGQERYEQFEAAMESLTPEHRDVIGLARIVGLPITDVAERMERTPGATRALLGRALLALSDKLDRSE